jgi:acetylornithine deacetylase/succinyl-diaminopimelate desuccinylase-like protein
MNEASDLATAYARDNFSRFQNELMEFLAIPSVSTEPERKQDVGRAAQWLAEHLRNIGAVGVSVTPTEGHPVVFGEWTGAGADARTVLVYGHYDVVPASLDDGWNTDPFQPEERDGYLYGRGASDDKGQLFTHVKAFESYLKSTDTMPVNIKFFFEGEEELASPNLAPYLNANLDQLSADVCVISDTSMPRIDEPAILHSLRGMTFLEIHVSGPSDDLHSGFWGGAVHNPALALVEILSRLHNEDHSVAVPGFYDDVVALTDAERAEIEKTSISTDHAVSLTGVPELWGESQYTIKERVTARPTLELNGIGSGWTGIGPKTIIPATAMAKISCRLVGNQDPHRIFELIRDFVLEITPKSVSSRVDLITTGEPALFPFDLPEMKAAVRAYERGWGRTPVFTRGGGSIPVVADIARLMNIPVVMMGFGLDDDGLHGANERFGVENLRRGIATSIAFLDEVSQLKSDA